MYGKQLGRKLGFPVDIQYRREKETTKMESMSVRSVDGMLLWKESQYQLY